MNLMHDLEGHLPLPSQIGDVLLFFRKMAFQQFWLQHRLNLADFARQSILFGKLNQEHPFQKSFEEKTGITISEFMELAIMLVTRFVATKEIWIDKDWFRSASEYYGDGTAQRFLDCLSSDITMLKTILIRDSSRHSTQHEIYEKTPLRNTPLFKIQGRYFSFSRELLARSLENKIYDTLRSDNPGEFMNKFGPIFEKYVGETISKTGLPVVNESDLRKVFPESKVVDYLLVDNGTNIFIDAKGVEMAYLGMVGHQPEIITDKTRDSILKGIMQGFETAANIKDLNMISGIPLGKNNSYLFVVTYKDMFLGTGQDFYESVAKATLNEIVAKFDGVPPISYDHMYFISIEEFDLLVSAICSKQIALNDFLVRVVQNDAAFQTKKFTFDQHIFEFFPDVQPPDWLIEESNKIRNRCAAILKK
jgi:hypothetical protein